MSPVRPPVHGTSCIRGLVVTVGGFVVLGVLAAWLWSVLAEPAAYTVTVDGAQMGETEAAEQFGVAVTFAWLGGLLAVVWGAFCGWRFAGHGWPHVVVSLFGAVAASAVAWRLGIALGPPDPTSVVKSAEMGSQVPMGLRVDSHGLLLVWPVAALSGLLAAVTWLVPRDIDDVTP